MANVGSHVNFYVAAIVESGRVVLGVADCLGWGHYPMMIGFGWYGLVLLVGVIRAIEFSALPKEE